jgi:hypothetical protein
VLWQEQWLEFGTLELNLNNNFESLQILALEVEELLPVAKDRIKKKVILHDNYGQLCEQVVSEGNIDKSFLIKDELLCWDDMIYVPERLQQRRVR